MKRKGTQSSSKSSFVHSPHGDSETRGEPTRVRSPKSGTGKTLCDKQPKLFSKSLWEEKRKDTQIRGSWRAIPTQSPCTGLMWSRNKKETKSQHAVEWTTCHFQCPHQTTFQSSFLSIQLEAPGRWPKSMGPCHPSGRP